MFTSEKVEISINKHISNCQIFMILSGCSLACQQELSLVPTKTPPTHYYTLMDTHLVITQGSCVLNAREDCVSHDAYVRKQNLCDFCFLD